MKISLTKARRTNLILHKSFCIKRKCSWNLFVKWVISPRVVLVDGWFHLKTARWKIPWIKHLYPKHFENWHCAETGFAICIDVDTVFISTLAFVVRIVIIIIFIQMSPSLLFVYFEWCKETHLQLFLVIYFYCSLFYILYNV